MNEWRSQWQKTIGLAIATFLIVLLFQISTQINPSFAQIPFPRIHPLPPSLANWKDRTNSGDYFEQIERTPLGYLIWSQFPVSVYIQQSNSYTDSAADKRFEQWVTAVKKAISEWNVYLPLEEVTDREEADIIVLRSQPEREVKIDPNTGLYDIPRAIAAETTYKFFVRQNPPTIAHKMTVEISPNFTGVSLLATARHELGHALGIWGHSPQKTDALYFSQVSDPPKISPRDVNTLKKIYQQPTKLGWEIDN